MDAETEISTLQAEALAVQAVLIAVCRRLAREQPALAPVLCAAFDDAETLMSGLAVRLGIDVPPETTLGPLRVIDELRAAVITEERMCGPDRG
ncbi:MAG: hypothetical protein ACK40O_12335 [Allosphingosinicella sp.]